MKKISLSTALIVTFFSILPNAFAANEPKYPEVAYGEYEVEGFLLRNEGEIMGEKYQEAFFEINSGENQLLLDYFNYMIEQGNTVNTKTKNEKLRINLGCFEGDAIKTGWFEIRDNAFKILRNSHKRKQVKTKITIGEIPNIDGGCLSLLKDIKIIGNEKDLAGTFADVSTLHPNSEAIEMLFKSSFIKGYADGTFQPDKEINRAELIKMVVEIIVGDPTKLKTVYYDCFKDVKKEWFAPYVCYAKQMNWIKGYEDGKFRPGNNASRVEAIKIALNAFYAAEIPAITLAEMYNLEMPSDSVENDWYNQFLKYALGKNLLDLQHTIHRNNTYQYGVGTPITRKEVAEMLFRLTNL